MPGSVSGTGAGFSSDFQWAYFVPSKYFSVSEENAVIVTNAKGSIVRFGPQEGVAFEAIEAFHTVEAEPSQ